MASPNKMHLWGTRILAMPLALTIALAGCAAKEPASAGSEAEGAAAEESAEAEAEDTSAKSRFSLTRDDLTINETITDDADESHAILADGTTDTYKNIEVLKTGAADGDEADFYGTNAAVYATNGASLSLSDSYISTDGMHANAVFSYGAGTTINIVHSVIETVGNCSGGIMVTGGGTINATDLAIHTTGNSSAAIRSDRGGGTENVTGGTYVTEGKGSPVIYSTADVYVTSATLESTSSQGVVVEGKNSVTLTDVDLIASNVSKNSDKSDWYQAVMIYQSMSGDADEGKASFTMTGGSLTNKNGDVFFVNNTVADIKLTGTTIENEDEDGNFMRIAAAGWGNEGSNGGHVTLSLAGEQVEGDILVDDVSELNATLKDKTSLTGAINPANEGAVYVEIESGSSWTLTADSYVTSLTCDAGAIKLNGHTLYVDGVAYEDGSASSGTPIEFTLPTGGGMGMGEPPAGGPGGGPGGEPPAGGPGGEPPAKPGE